MKNKLVVLALLGWLGVLNFHLTAYAQPALTTLAASGVTGTNATLNGSVNPNGAATTAYFQYGLTTNYGSFSATNSLAAGNSTLPVSNLISNLALATTYHFRIVGANSFGADVGTDLTFTTAQVPVAVTANASGVTSTNATLNGTLLTGGLNTTAYFRYGLTTNYGSFSGTSLLAGTNTTLSVSILIGGLSLNTTYYFQLVVTNSAGTALSKDFTFTTVGLLPIVTTLPTSITLSNVTLNGTVNPNGTATLAYFQYGLTTNYEYLGGFTNLPPETNTTLTLPGFAANIRGAAGATWTQSDAYKAKTWVSIVSSADGTRLAAACHDRGPGIWTSADGGLTWTQTSAPAVPWQSIASSLDGARLAAVVDGGGIWTSTNGGGAWMQTSAPATNWNTIVAAANGTRLAAAVNGGGIWTSADGGLTWTQTSAPGLSWTSITSSADGRRLAAVASGGGIYFSTDSGWTWTQSNAPNQGWSGIASSADGSRLTASASGIWTSTDGGVTWTMTSAPASSFRSVVSSFDGMRLAALLAESLLWTSTDGGVTWAQANSPYEQGISQSWKGIASSADGSRLAVASEYFLGIWISTGAASDLLAVTVYHYRAVGINAAGMGLGSDLTFTNVPLAPLVSSLAATDITATTATLNGAVNPNGAATTAYFRYGVTTNYGNFSATNSLAGTNMILSVSNSISSLMYGTTYHFQLVANNSAGTALSGDFLFITKPLPPVVTTLPATSITLTNGTLNGTVNPKGDTTTAYFQYGLTTNYGYLGGFAVLPPATNTTLTMTGLVVSSLGGAAGADWTPSSAPSGNWNSIASSADGTRLAAVQHQPFGRIYVSTDSGVTWTDATGAAFYWKSIASSADGTRLVAGSNGDGIWTSTNGGLTWAHSFAPPGFAAWYSVTTSADGMRMAGVNQSSIYVSVDGGLTWTQSSAPGANWLCIASSADGTRLTAGIYGGGIWTSADGGLTWTQTSAPGGNWKSLASSADGTRLMAGAEGGGVWISADGGVTWVPAGLSGNSWCVASSADGLRLAAGSSIGGVPGIGDIYSSTNGGVTWTPSSAPDASWVAIASSAEGTQLAAVIFGGGIFTSTAGAGSGLTPGTTCHYRLVGINSGGTTLGSNLTFTTSAAAPLVSTLAASGIGGTTATLNGAVNANGAATMAYFRYGLTTNYGSFSATISLPATNATLLVSNLISGLSPETTYHCQFVSSNSVGTSLGADRTFTTTAATPQVTTLPASSFTGTSAMLNGTVNPNAAATSAYFQYGLTANYGSFSATNSLAATNATLPVSNLIGGLSPGLTYHFRLVASNNAGTVTGADQIFGTFFPHVFIGAQPGQGLDLQGTFVYAVNVGANGAPGLIGDANFTADNVPGVTIAAVGAELNTLNGFANPNFGSTTDAVRLAQAMSSIRWTAEPGILTVNLDGLQVGQGYQLQLLFIESCCDRAFDVKVNGTTIAPSFGLLGYGPTETAIVIPYVFTAMSTSALIQLGGGTPAGKDGNPTLSAFTLEDLSPAVPISLTARSLGGAFQLSFTSLSGLGFTVLGATNLGLPLSNWTVLGAPTEAPPGQYQFTDSQTTNSPRRFYRLRSP